MSDDKPNLAARLADRLGRSQIVSASAGTIAGILASIYMPALTSHDPRVGAILGFCTGIVGQFVLAKVTLGSYFLISGIKLRRRLPRRERQRLDGVVARYLLSLDSAEDSDSRLDGARAIASLKEAAVAHRTKAYVEQALEAWERGELSEEVLREALRDAEREVRRALPPPQ